MRRSLRKSQVREIRDQRPRLSDQGCAGAAASAEGAAQDTVSAASAKVLTVGGVAAASAEVTALESAETVTPAAAVEAAASADGEDKIGVKQETERFFEVLLAVALALLSWGAYGPVLHKGQAAMGGSRLRPLICIGVAYFLIAVLVPMALRINFCSK